MGVLDVLAGQHAPIPVGEVLDLDVDGGTSDVVVAATAASFDMIERVILVMRFASATFSWSEIAADTALATGFQMQYNGVGFGPVIKDNGDFFDVGYDVTLSNDGVATPNYVIAARWSFNKFTPHGLGMWDASNTFGFNITDDMTAKTSIASLEAIVQGWRAPA